ncbi:MULTISPECIES: hypothetical protein [unclassified Nocardia]|uniref:hypothetical protein n=1 Tax=unclassified Nocardia TaxID=2637762 RepID=UPI001CE3CAD1|nr:MULTISPECIES: hypothetical protein [unclassified Nocardia]
MVTTATAISTGEPGQGGRMAFDRGGDLWHERGRTRRWQTGTFPHQRFCRDLAELEERFGPLTIVPYMPWPDPPQDPQQARPGYRDSIITDRRRDAQQEQRDDDR